MSNPETAPSVGIIDYGMGNLRSVFKAFTRLGVNVEICQDGHDLAHFTRLVLPGVGAFRDGMQNLASAGFIDPLEKQVLSHRVPILGICLGMELLARSSTEGGDITGLGWIDAHVDRLPNKPSIRVPHVGWNDVQHSSAGGLLDGISNGATFYFNHSYCVRAADEGLVTGTCTHGEPFAAVVSSGPIMGCQFHPEKSQDAGRRLLLNFVYGGTDEC
jgi:imidazole glycerol-phosphate synthase subunit HisH